MGRGSVRAGAPVYGTTVNDGTDNSLTDPRIIIFDPPVRPCLIYNNNTNERALAKINVEPVDSDGTVTNDFDNDSDDDGGGHFRIPRTVVTVSGAAVPLDASMGGQVLIHSVSLVTTHASDDLDNISVIGWAP
jgi:hypothetical protein